MGNHCFSFLEDSYPEICNEAKYCEKHLVEKSYKDSSGYNRCNSPYLRNGRLQIYKQCAKTDAA